jgi:hypothetical protein
MVQQNADGMIFVRTPGGTYMDTIANFQLDFNDTVSPLPQGANDRVYDQGVRHAISNNFTIIAAGHMPWPQGDAWIANISAGLSAQAARIAAKPKPPIPGGQNALNISQASQDDGSSSPQPQVRQESRSPTIGGEGVQSSRRKDWHLAKEKTEELKRRL